MNQLNADAKALQDACANPATAENEITTKLGCASHRHFYQRLSLLGSLGPS
jgi:hypothetical protein